jgi:hypothetical protein
MGAWCLTMKGPKHIPEPMIVQYDDRAISHRQRWERTERSATTSASRTTSNIAARRGLKEA